MSKPLFVAISDVHYSASTLELADLAMRAAIAEAHHLRVRLVVAGDFHDSKGIIRGECANQMIRTLEYAQDLNVEVFVLIGNHDKLHEKSRHHALNFLRPYATIIDEPRKLSEFPGVGFIPYQSDGEALEAALSEMADVKYLVMHQGVKGAFMGEYTVDKTSVDPARLAAWTVISGHYHRTQKVGTLTYIGTPYTVTFAEANDGPKGYQIVHKDFTMKQVPLNIRKHVIIETSIQALWDFDQYKVDPFQRPNADDVVWMKLSGPSVELAQVSKKTLGMRWFGHANYKLDKIPTDEQGEVREIEKMTPEQMLDSLVDESDETAPQKQYLKSLWRDVLA